jgi:hypothetical protein
MVQDVHVRFLKVKKALLELGKFRIYKIKKTYMSFQNILVPQWYATSLAFHTLRLPFLLLGVVHFCFREPRQATRQVQSLAHPMKSRKTYNNETF